MAWKLVLLQTQERSVLRKGWCEGDREKIMERDNAQRRTSAVSEAFLDTSENTGIGGLGRHANGSCESQSEVKRMGQHGGRECNTLGC